MKKTMIFHKPVTQKKQGFWRNFKAGPSWVILSLKHDSIARKSITVILFRWFKGYFSRFVSVAGILFFLAFIVALAVSAFSSKNYIKLIAGIMLGLLIADFIFGWIFRPKLEVKRFVPERARQGSEVLLKYRLRSFSYMPCFDLLVDYYSPSKEIEVKKNQPRIDRISSQGVTEFTRSFYLKKRGKYYFPAVVSTSLFPFNLLNFSCCSVSKQSILVYPNFTPLENLFLPEGKKYQRSGNSMVHNVGDSNEFAGCRYYRYGDDIRKIDWKSTARSGDLTVKEYHQDYLTRTAVILDTGTKSYDKLREFFMLPAKHSDQKLEAAVSLAAAIADYICREDNIVDIFAVGSNVHHLKAGRGHACLDAILDILSCVEVTSAGSISNISETVINEISSIGSAIIISAYWDDDREELQNKMLYNGTVVKKIIIGKEYQFNSVNDICLNYKDIIDGIIKQI